MIKPQNYIFVKESIPHTIEQNSILNILTNNVTAQTHGFHRYPAKFIPQVPRWAIEKYLVGQNEKLILYPSNDAINKLSLIRTLINKIPDELGRNKKIRNIQNLLIICFSAIIRRVSNADNESQKTYVSHTKIKIPEETINLFFSKLDLFKERISIFSQKINHKLKSKIICSSSAKGLEEKLKEKKST